MRKTFVLQRRTYTIEEVADLFGLNRNTAYAMARADELPVPTIKIGKRMFVSRAALDRLLDSPDAEPPELRECVWDDSVLDAEPIAP